MLPLDHLQGKVEITENRHSNILSEGQNLPLGVRRLNKTGGFERVSSGSLQSRPREQNGSPQAPPPPAGLPVCAPIEVPGHGAARRESPNVHLPITARGDFSAGWGLPLTPKLRQTARTLLTRGFHRRLQAAHCQSPVGQVVTPRPERALNIVPPNRPCETAGRAPPSDTPNRCPPRAPTRPPPKPRPREKPQ